ncbi:hypothetical protein GCM10007966_06070 [Legionella impletisoli]|uniref:Uncharacterized protein n=1 Tax=Legionella impletisoli TaxID=343510 RepID=A0A917JT41_9GAMM|nr:hypothetical protein GCM10007966_06070 [Legionella impletisoli]
MHRIACTPPEVQYLFIGNHNALVQFIFNPVFVNILGMNLISDDKSGLMPGRCCIDFM